MNRASSEPPKPKPTRMAVAVFWSQHDDDRWRRAGRGPTTNMPVTAPVRKATLRPAAIEPSRAAAAVRTLPRTAVLMPM